VIKAANADNVPYAPVSQGAIPLRAAQSL